jgi:hypothetical protein
MAERKTREMEERRSNECNECNECNGERQARKEAREMLDVEEGKIRFLSFLLFMKRAVPALVAPDFKSPNERGVKDDRHRNLTPTVVIPRTGRS